MQFKIKIISIFIVLFTFLSSQVNAQERVEKKFFFTGHCYQPYTAGDKVDYRLEEFDFTDYEGVWLGGDVCSEALLKYSTVQYLDDIFDLGNIDTHWALGNHDTRNGNWEYVSEFSGRKTYYAYSNQKMTRIVLNTNIVPTECEMMNDQYSMIENVCDTIQESKYLVLLMHHGLWFDVPGLPPPQEYSHSNLKYWNSNCYDVNSNFINSIYPKLLEVQSRGVEVICVMGDIGHYTNRFDMLSDDGIRFLGSGLYLNEADNNVLIFTYNIQTYNLSWGFHNLDSLLLEQKKLPND